MTQAQTYQNNVDFYRNGDLRYQFDLSENQYYCYLKIDYIPAPNSPAGGMSSITNVAMTDDRPHDYTRAVGGWAPNPFNGTVYVYYRANDDSITFASYGAHIMSFLPDALTAAGLATSEARSSSFQRLKRNDTSSEVSPVVDVLVNDSSLRYDVLTKIVLWLGYALGVALSLMIGYFLIKRFVR